MGIFEHVFVYAHVTDHLPAFATPVLRKAWKPDIAAELLRKFNNHRLFLTVSLFTCVCIGSGTLRADMEAHAAGRGMSQRLCQEIRA